MVDPYDFVASPSAPRSKQTRRKAITKTAKKRKSNEKSRRGASASKTHQRTRSNTRDVDQEQDTDGKENTDHGFTQLIQTKMMEVKKRQGKKAQRPINTANEESHSPSVARKRLRSDQEETSAALPTSSDIDPPSDVLRPNDENANIETPTAIDPKTTCQHRCETKEQNPILNSKRRRGCLCSKRQLDELEFAPDSAPSQTPQRSQQQYQKLEEQELRDEPQVEPILTSMHQTPPPLLLPSSDFVPPFTSTYPSLNLQAALPPEESDKSEGNHEEEEEERADRSRVPSMLGAPLSPTMPLNSTYIARRTMTLVTQLPSTLLAMSSLIPTHTNPSILAPVESAVHCTNQNITMPPVQRSVSTQTDDTLHPTHHRHCSDVSECPCVQIYNRSEQLFMTSMAIFFRNSANVITPPEQTRPSWRATRANRRQQTSHRASVTQATPAISEVVVPIPAEVDTQTKDPVQINETYLVENNNDTVLSSAREVQQTSATLLNASTVIHETQHEHSKKADGSSIQVHIHPKEDSLEEIPLAIPSHGQHRFQSLVLAMTALKDEQKAEFNRFIERFSIRSSSIVDDTTTHLITDEDSEHSLTCPLTGKVLQAVARHLIIVSHRWLTACLTEQRYIDESPTYEITGDTIYNQHHGMSRSRLHHSTNYRLLANYAFHMKCHGCQPFNDNRPLIELIHLSGGLILKTLNQHIGNIGRQIIILCSKTYLQNKPALQQACAKLNILCLEPEWLIASVVKFGIEPYDPWLCTLYS